VFQLHRPFKRAAMMLMWPTVKMSLTALLYGVRSASIIENAHRETQKCKKTDSQIHSNAHEYITMCLFVDRYTFVWVFETPLSLYSQMRFF